MSHNSDFSVHGIHLVSFIVGILAALLMISKHDGMVYHDNIVSLARKIFEYHRLTRL
jgi:hypothetical protein